MLTESRDSEKQSRLTLEKEGHFKRAQIQVQQALDLSASAMS